MNLLTSLALLGFVSRNIAMPIVLMQLPEGTDPQKLNGTMFTIQGDEEFVGPPGNRTLTAIILPTEALNGLDLNLPGLSGRRNFLFEATPSTRKNTSNHQNRQKWDRRGQNPSSNGSENPKNEWPQKKFWPSEKSDDENNKPSRRTHNNDQPNHDGRRRPQTDYDEDGSQQSRPSYGSVRTPWGYPTRGLVPFPSYIPKPYPKEERPASSIYPEMSPYPESVIVSYPEVAFESYPYESSPTDTNSPGSRFVEIIGDSYDPEMSATSSFEDLPLRSQAAYLESSRNAFAASLVNGGRNYYIQDSRGSELQDFLERILNAGKTQVSSFDDISSDDMTTARAFSS